MSDTEHLQAILAAPVSDAPRAAYAEWLEARDPATAAWLRAEIALYGGESPDRRERYHATRAAAGSRRLALLEQPALLRTSPVRLPPGWWSVELGQKRPAGGTYQCYDSHALPALDIDRFLDFAWLTEAPPRISELSEHWAEGVEALRGRIEGRGHRADALIALLRERVPEVLVVDSCTDCFFTPDYGPAAALGGLLIPFYWDSQSCVGWGLWRHRSGSEAVLSFGPAFYDEEKDEREPEEPRVHFADADEPLDGEGTRALDLRFAAPSLAEFIYRMWMENELWYITHDHQPRGRATPTLTPEMQRYLDRL